MTKKCAITQARKATLRKKNTEKCKNPSQHFNNTHNKNTKKLCCTGFILVSFGAKTRLLCHWGFFLMQQNNLSCYFDIAWTAGMTGSRTHKEICGVQAQKTTRNNWTNVQTQLNRTRLTVEQSETATDCQSCWASLRTTFWRQPATTGAVCIFLASWKPYGLFSKERGLVINKNKGLQNLICHKTLQFS